MCNHTKVRIWDLEEDYHYLIRYNFQTQKFR